MICKGPANAGLFLLQLQDHTPSFSGERRHADTVQEVRADGACSAFDILEMQAR
jgi:hypothetical protein